jgi:hypothetical protein
VPAAVKGTHGKVRDAWPGASGQALVDWAFDPDKPGSGADFISDGQMRVLNITIRRAVHEALDQVDVACEVVRRPGSRSPHPEEIAALDFCAFQLGTVRDYMEAPGSAELEEAYQRYVREPDVNR